MLWLMRAIPGPQDRLLGKQVRTSTNLRGRTFQPIHAMSLFVPALKRLAQEGKLSANMPGEMANRLLDVSRLAAGAVRVVKEDFCAGTAAVFGDRPRSGSHHRRHQRRGHDQVQAAGLTVKYKPVDHAELQQFIARAR
jgi:hypothetical protein